MYKYVILCDYENYNRLIEKRVPVERYYKILITENAMLQDSCSDIYNEIYYVDKLCSKEGFEYIDEIFDKISKGSSIGGIFALSERLVEKTAELREKYSVPFGIKGKAGYIFRNKLAMKEYLSSKSSINIPRFASVYSYKDITEFITSGNCKCILKPVDSMGSDRVAFIDIDNCIEFRNEIDNNDNRYEIEEFIEGHMYHVDSIIYNGEVRMVSVGEYAHSTMECVNSTPLIGYIHSNIDDDIIREVLKTNREVISAMPIREGITHMEVIYNDTEKKVYFIEIAARIVGCGVDFAIGSSCNRMFIEEAVAATFGIEPGTIDEIARKPVGYIIFYKKDGRIIKISEEEDFKDIPEVRDVFILNKEGDVIQSRHTSGDVVALVTWECEQDDTNSLAKVGQRVQEKWRLEIE